MKKWTLLALIFVLGCSSAPKSEDSAPAESDYNEMSPIPEEQPQKSRPAKAETTSEDSKPIVSSSKDEAQALADAVKTENDESIARAATAVLSRNPNDAKALNALGLYHYKKNHIPAAIMMLDKALKANPNFADAHNNLGLCFLAQKEERNAIIEFRKALELDSNNVAAASNLGSLYIEHKEYPKALIALEIAYKKSPKDQKILNNYGIALAANGKPKDAKDIYKQALSLNSSNKDVMFNYAVLMIDNLNEKQAGLDLLGRLRFLGPSSEVRNRINVLENKAKAGLK